MGARTKARKRALDMLYVADVRQVPLQEVLDEEARRAVAQPQRASSWPYAEQIVRGVVEHQRELDAELGKARAHEGVSAVGGASHTAAGAVLVRKVAGKG